MTVFVTGPQRTANCNIRLSNLKHVFSQRFVRKTRFCSSCMINTYTSCFEVGETCRKMMLAAEPLLFIVLTDLLDVSEDESRFAYSLVSLNMECFHQQNTDQVSLSQQKSYCAGSFTSHTCTHTWQLQTTMVTALLQSCRGRRQRCYSASSILVCPLSSTAVCLSGGKINQSSVNMPEKSIP